MTLNLRIWLDTVNYDNMWYTKYHIFFYAFALKLCRICLEHWVRAGVLVALLSWAKNFLSLGTGIVTAGYSRSPLAAGVHKFAPTKFRHLPYLFFENKKLLSLKLQNTNLREKIFRDNLRKTTVPFNWYVFEWI